MYVLANGTGDHIEACCSDTTYYSGREGVHARPGREVPIGRREALRPRIAYQHGAVSTLHSHERRPRDYRMEGERAFCGSQIPWSRLSVIDA